MKYNYNDGVLTVYLTGHIDSANALATEKSMMEAISSCRFSSLVIDLSQLEYISSAGLRILLKIRKMFSSIKAINASSEVYEIFEVTGFTELIPISKAMREIDIAGCEVVGEGANGIVYRIGRDTIVKVYKDAEALEDIQRERELSRTAFLLGIPTAISYDVVKVGQYYGAVFELLDAKSFAELMQESTDNLEFVAERSVEVAKIIHSTPAPDGLPDEFETVLGWIDLIRDYLTDEEYEKFRSLVNALPHEGTLIHGDYHVKNIMQQGDETLLIDMDTLSVGHPIFELAFMYNAYKGFGIVDSGIVTRFLGFDSAVAYRMWRRMLALYLGTDDAAVLDEAEGKAALIGLLRLMRRAFRLETDQTVFINTCRDEIKNYLKRFDTLEFR